MADQSLLAQARAVQRQALLKQAQAIQQSKLQQQPAEGSEAERANTARVMGAEEGGLEREDPLAFLMGGQAGVGKGILGAAARMGAVGGAQATYEGKNLKDSALQGTEEAGLTAATMGLIKAPGAILRGARTVGADLAGMAGVLPGRFGAGARQLERLLKRTSTPGEAPLTSGARTLPPVQGGGVTLEPAPQGGTLGPRGVSPRLSPEEVNYQLAPDPTIELQQGPGGAPRYRHSVPRQRPEEIAAVEARYADSIRPEPTLSLEQPPPARPRGRVPMAPQEAPPQALSEALQAPPAPKPGPISGLRELEQQGKGLEGLSSEELMKILDKELKLYNYNK